MSGEIIKQFLVGLGFEIDESSLKKFNNSIGSAATRVTALFAAITASTAGIVFGVSKISDSFEQMGYEYRIIAPMLNKQLYLRQELLKAYKATGINIVQVVQNSVRLNLSLAKTKFALEAIYKSVGSRFFTLLTQQSDLFRDRLYKNLPKIQNFLERFIKFVFKAFEAITELGIRLWSILGRVYDFFERLDKATDGWSTKILAFIAAWQLLNLSFLATPFGLLLAGFLAILALYDDFKTFKEGGKSFFDWTKIVPEVDALLAVLSQLLNIIIEIGGALKNTFTLNWSGLLGNLKQIANAFVVISEAIDSVVRHLGGGVINKLLDFRDSIDNAVGLGAGTQPLGVGGSQSAQTNVHVNQQTQVNVNSSADANAVGKSVAGEQSRVNFNYLQNLKGAVNPGPVNK